MAILSLSKEISPTAVHTHGGYARSVTWILRLNDMLIYRETDNYSLDTLEKDFEPPYLINSLYKNLKEALFL